MTFQFLERLIAIIVVQTVEITSTGGVIRVILSFDWLFHNNIGTYIHTIHAVPLMG
jgi:hypothetical protein